ncbi:MAG TPA: CoA transferase [Hypericibacter adhaerens]|uniref:CoA transferase n=1 Tax=Hypericibacter adhaerens TaxID=2602016 RepID=UPI002C4B35F7|nr:CoA transferase [Hypericibacter adhaerens]HWA45871.1 CoA transferase [Hypericibacter adhaerens]
MTYDLLRGCRVIESAAFIAAPLCGMTLAQLGADVIRVDMIGGGIDYERLPLAPAGRSLYWTSLNKGKRSVAIDIRKPEGRRLLQRLVTAPGPGGGILLTNIPTAWLAHATLAEARRDLVSCTIEGSSDGSTAVDYTVNCATGYPALTGEGSRDKPVNHVLPAWDVICAMQAAMAVIAAVDRRRRTDQGAELRLALSDVAFSTLSHLGLLAEAQLIEQERTSIGNHIYGAFGRDFATRDGQRIMVAAISLKQWNALVEACGLAAIIGPIEQGLGCDFSKEGDRFAHRQLIAGLVEPWCAARSLDEIKPVFDRAGVCWGPYRTVKELVAQDPRVSLANPIFETMDPAGVGPHLAAGPALRIAAAERKPSTAAPLLGQHTDPVLQEVLRLSPAEIDRLHEEGIVAGAERDPLLGTDR